MSPFVLLQKGESVPLRDARRTKLAGHLRAAHAGTALIAVLAAILLSLPHTVVSNVEHFGAGVRMVRSLAFAYLAMTGIYEVYALSIVAQARPRGARLVALVGHALVLIATVLAFVKGPRSVALLSGLAETLTLLLTVSTIAAVVAGLELWMGPASTDSASPIATAGRYRLLEYAYLGASIVLAAALVYLEMQPLPN